MSEARRANHGCHVPLNLDGVGEYMSKASTPGPGGHRRAPHPGVGRWRAIAGLAAGLCLLAACTVPEKSPAGATPSTSAPAPAPAAAEPGATVQVTVPGLGGSAPAVIGSGGQNPGSAGSGAEPVQTIAIDPAACGGCTQLASHKDVRDGLSAVFVAVKGRAALLSVDAGGAVKQVANVPYGTTFAPPAGGALPCDSAGRCLVIGKTADGKTIGSAFTLDAGGGWTDVSPPGGFRSDTDRGQVVDLDGEPGIAVQTTGEGRTVWSVYAWDSDSYQLVGCAPDGDLDLTKLSPDVCVS